MENKKEAREARDDWKLKEIKLELQSYGENKGKYEGTIRFQNGEYESFSFKIREDMAEPYINLIGDDIVKCADNLASRLVESLGLKRQEE